MNRAQALGWLGAASIVAGVAYFSCLKGMHVFPGPYYPQPLLRTQQQLQHVLEAGDFALFGFALLALAGVVAKIAAAFGLLLGAFNIALEMILMARFPAVTRFACDFTYFVANTLIGAATPIGLAVFLLVLTTLSDRPGPSLIREHA